MPLRSVLLVDDEPILLDIAALALRATGTIEVVTAGSGVEAVEAAAAKRPDVVLLDVLMPDMDGRATLAALRARPETASVPVVFMTGLSHPEEAEELRALGALGIIRKPFQPATLAADLSRMLDLPVQALTAQGRAAIEEARADPILFRDKVRELATAFDVVRRFGGREAIDTLRLLAHRLRGTAGSYGLPLVGTAAGRIEDALAGWDDDDRARREATEALVVAALTDAEYAASRSEQSLSIPAMNLVTGHVLLVDPDPTFVAVMAETARRQLVHLEGASDADAALAVARTHALDAAILALPAVGGEAVFALARALCAVPGNERLPIAFLAEAPSIEQQVEAAHAGAALFLERPLEPHAITAALQRLLSLHGGTPRPRALAIDDDPAFLATLGKLLTKEGFVVATSTEPETALDRLDEVAPDVVFLDVEMPGIGGLDICRMMRMKPRWQELPVFFLTAHADLDSRLQGFAAGGTDYIVKPIVRAELLARVRSRLHFDSVLRERADRDSLTQLLSRRAFLEALSIRASEARRHERTLSVCILDLDHFKQTNDTYGHLAGDRVLASLGKILAARFRAEDLRARWGGEEFVLAFPGVHADRACVMIERVLAEFRLLRFESDTGEPFGSTFSAGVAELASGDDVETALQLADKRLYVAKRDGRARVVGS